jgi:hypothetical protein
MNKFQCESAYDVDWLAFYEGVQVAEDALRESGHPVFVGPGDVGSDN